MVGKSLAHVSGVWAASEHVASQQVGGGDESLPGSLPSLIGPERVYAERLARAAQVAADAGLPEADDLARRAAEMAAKAAKDAPPDAKKAAANDRLEV